MATDPYSIMSGYNPASDPMSMGMPQGTQNFIQTLSADTGNMQPVPGVTPAAPDPSQMPPMDYSDPMASNNFMQGADPSQPAAAPPGSMPQQMPDEPAPGGNAPRKRLSLVDTIGRISDVLAKTGGATEQYQPYLDSRIATQQTQQGNALDMDAKRADIAQTGTATQTAQNAIMGHFAQGVKAAIAQGVDPHQAIASAAQTMGIPPAIAATFGHAYNQNPGIIDAYTQDDPNKEVYGTAPQWFQGPDGKPVLVQVSNKGNSKIVDPGDGYTPSDLIKTDNLGNSMDFRGAHSATPVRSATIQGKIGQDEQQTTGPNGQVKIAPLPGSVAAVKSANDTTRAQAAATTAGAAVTRANNAGKGPGGANGKPTSSPAAALATLDNIQSSFDRLHHMNALAGEDGLGLGRTKAGQAIGAHFGKAAAEERVLLSKSLGSLQSDLLSSLPGSATRTRFEQEIQKQRLPDPMTMTYATANQAIQQYRNAYKTALASAPASTGRPVLPAPPRGASKPQVIGW